jgi:ABC-type transport system substrate-binding protein
MKKLLTVFLVALIAGAALATEPINISLVPDAALYDRDVEIRGLTLSIWGENPQTSFALGFVNGSTGQSVGLSIGLLNYSDSYKGFQWGVVNYAKQDFTGWQGGFVLGIMGSIVNYTDGTMTGFQSGVVNYAGNLRGFQLGFVNYAKTVDNGLQIGFVNLMPENEWFEGLPEELAPGMIIVNWHF